MVNTYFIIIVRLVKLMDEIIYIFSVDGFPWRQSNTPTESSGSLSNIFILFYNFMVGNISYFIRLIKVTAMINSTT
jgi:hypothetical protein